MTLSSGETFPYIVSDASREKYNLRLSQPVDPTKLPPGFPQEITSQPLWSAPTIQGTWSHDVTSDELKGIEEAADNFQASGKDLRELSPATFPLEGSLKEVIDRAITSLYEGLGFMRFRGITPGPDRTRNVIIHAGLTSYFGDRRGYITPGLEKTPVLAHITDLHSASSSASPAYTNGQMTFHTDLGDIVSLFTLDQGISGGAFYLASAWDVYNRLAKSQPEVLLTLSQNYEMRGLNTSTPRTQPLLHLYDNERVFLQSFRRQFTGPNPIDITDAQKYALDAIHIAAGVGALTVPFETGDLLIFNNLALLHSRDCFDSEPGAVNNRHLLKLFVQDTKRLWGIPDILKPQWDMMYNDRPGTLGTLADGVRGLSVGRAATSAATYSETGTASRAETFNLYPPAVPPTTNGWEQNG